jgi:hypothetical protein
METARIGIVRQRGKSGVRHQCAWVPYLAEKFPVRVVHDYRCQMIEVLCHCIKGNFNPLLMLKALHDAIQLRCMLSLNFEQSMNNWNEFDLAECQENECSSIDPTECHNCPVA